jgi:hypothetical protein
MHIVEAGLWGLTIGFISGQCVAILRLQKRVADPFRLNKPRKDV